MRTFPKLDPKGTLSNNTPALNVSGLFVRSGGAGADGGAGIGDSERWGTSFE